MTHYPVSLQETSVFSVTFTAIPIINQDVRELQRRLVYHIFLPNQSYLSVKLYLKEVTITLFLCYCIYISILLVHNGRSPSDNELAPQSCSYGFVPNEKTRSCYKFLSVKVDFQNAFEACFHRDSLLVSLKDEEENTFVANLVKANSESDSEATDSNDVWIGLVNFENHWRWMYPTSSKYMNWAPEMPDKNPKNVVAKMRIGKKNEWINVNPSNTVDKARVVCKKPMGV